MQTPGMQQPMSYPQQQMGYPQQPMMMPFQQPAMVIEVAQPKPVTCDFKECDKPVVDKCFFYSPCGVAGCERNFCQEHAGKKNCLMTRSHNERRYSHGRAYNVSVNEKRPTPCVDCYPKAKKNSVNCYVMLAVFLFLPCVLIAIALAIYYNLPHVRAIRFANKALSEYGKNLDYALSNAQKTLNSSSYWNSVSNLNSGSNWNKNY